MFGQRALVGMAAIVGVVAVMAVLFVGRGADSAEAHLGSIDNSQMGYYHGCVLFDFHNPTLGVQCWGDNAYGQLGDGTTTGRMAPVTTFTSGVQQVVGGFEHTCALMTDGAVKCWGQNKRGQLGVAPLSSPDSCAGEPCSKLPLTISGLPADVVELAQASDGYGRATNCARTGISGNVWCWGFNGFGTMGDGTLDDTHIPQKVCAVGESDPCTSFLSGVTSVSGGASYHCALLSGGDVVCWGLNQSSYLGVPADQDDCNTTDPVHNAPCSPIPVETCADAAVPCTTLTDVAQLATGAGHNCVLMDEVEQGVECWGLNLWGQVGDGTGVGAPYSRPVCASGSGGTCVEFEDVRVVVLASSGYHTCAITEDDVLKCWGYNVYGQLGTGERSGLADTNPNPLDVELDLDGDDIDDVGPFSDVTLGGLTTCSQSVATPTVQYCWGDNRWGQVGDGTTVLKTLVTEMRWMSAAEYASDTDGDGCTAFQELSLDATTGGRRSPENPSDFYDINGDKVIDLPNDILSVINAAGNAPGPPYVQAYDRGPRIGSMPYDHTTYDGTIDLPNDISGVINQYGHSCQ